MKDQASQKRGRILAVLFVMMLLLPAPLWLLLAPVMDNANHENRTLASFPTTDTSIEEWPAAFEDWLNEHAPFRNEFMSLNGRLNWTVGTLDSSDVLLGKDHWLFLKNVSDSKSISDYQGLTAYTEAELADFTDTLSTLQNRLAEYGTRLVVVIAPAKEGVYSQYMPDSIPVVSRPTRVQALAGELIGAGVPLVWPQQTLIDLSAERQVYYKYDTHWNEVGAYQAVTQAEALLGHNLTPLEDCEVTVSREQKALTDLANVSAVWTLCQDDLYYSVDAPRAEQISCTPDGYRMHWQGTGEESLLMLRDSFGEMMAPFLCAGYDQSVVLHTAAVTVDVINEEMDGLPDVIVLEAAERYSDNLLGQGKLLLAWLDELEEN